MSDYSPVTESAVRTVLDSLGELVQHKRRDVDLSRFQRYADDPVGFAREVLKVDLWSAQEEIAQAVRDHPLITVRSGNSCGKDYTAAVLSLWWVYARGGFVLLTGPTERQVKHVLMGEVHRLYSGSELAGTADSYVMGLHLGHRVGILAFTSNEMSRLTGFHAPRLLVVVTESQGVADDTFEGLHRCATGAEDRQLIVGNPVAPTGYFFRTHEAETWHRIRIRVWDHPNIAGGRFIPGGPTREFIERIRHEYGEASVQWCYSIEGEFPEESEHALVRRAWLRQCERNGEPPPDTARIGPNTFGFDVAATGDRCAMAWFAGTWLMEVEAWQPEGDILREAGRMISRVKRALGPARPSGVSLTSDGLRIVDPGGWDYQAAVVVVDAGGLGLGVFEHLRRTAPVKVVPFVGSQAGDEGYLNERATAYVRLANALRRGELSIPHDESLWQELAETRVIEGDRLRIEPKAEIRKRIGRSPDVADATAMAWSQAEPLVRKQQRLRRGMW